MKKKFSLEHLPIFSIKGQISSEGLLVSSNSPKKRTNEFVVVVKTNSFVCFWEIKSPFEIIWLLVCNVFSFVFWKKLKTPNFEIIWPLVQEKRIENFHYTVLFEIHSTKTLGKDDRCNFLNRVHFPCLEKSMETRVTLKIMKALTNK